MIKEAGKVVLISSDHNLNQALFDQFKLVDFLDIEFFSDVGDYENNNHPDLIIYNNEVKKLQLLDIKNHIKTNKPSCPKIILNDYLDYSVKLKLDEKNDYIFIDKPLSYDFLEKVIFDTLKSYSSKVIYLDTVTFYPIKKLLVNSLNLEIRLTEKETDILLFLYYSVNKVVSKKYLLHKVWGYSNGVNTHTLETHLYYLRKKLDNDKLITTEKGGYLLSL
jgi:DNA-binding response OmpR family regulator